MLYKLAPVAFIGGSLVDRGGQNPIEAVRQGAVVLTGPHWQNFGDAYRTLLSNRGAIVVRSAEELASAARQLLSRRGRARQHARSRQRGARHHLGRPAAHHRGAAALPAARGSRCVRLDEPSWWYREAPERLAASCCSRSARVYGWAAAARYERATPYRSRLPVICIGNFTAGGTGKTPLAIHICERLKRAGHEPVALTRGYGGSLAGPLLGRTPAPTRRATSATRRCCWPAPRRRWSRATARQGARAIETGPHPATVIVMDDGLQNPRAGQGPDDRRGRRRARHRQRPRHPGRAAARAARLPARADRRRHRQRGAAGRRRPRRRTGCATASTGPCCAPAPSRPSDAGWLEGPARSWPGPASARRSASSPCSPISAPRWSRASPSAITRACRTRTPSACWRWPMARGHPGHDREGPGAAFRCDRRAGAPGRGLARAAHPAGVRGRRRGAPRQPARHGADGGARLAGAGVATLIYLLAKH